MGTIVWRKRRGVTSITLLQNASKRDWLLFGRSDSYWAHNPTPGLSIKTMRNGVARYQIEGGRFIVDDEHYLILNAVQPYTIEIESKTIVESFCVFFPPGWAEDAVRSAILPLEILLDNPLPSTSTPIHLFERVHRHDDRITPLLNQIKIALKEDILDIDWLENHLRGVLDVLLQVQVDFYREAEAFPAVRRATRFELYRRLHLAREFARAGLDQPINIEQMAEVACLSPFHFLRAFKQAFGQTPYQYLIEQRLARACFLLTHTRQPITDICLEVGFESMGSFSALFKRRMQCSPRAYRQQMSA